jgi:ribosome biogenesis protein Nip4
MIRAKKIEDFFSLFVRDFDLDYGRIGRTYFLKNPDFKVFEESNLSPFIAGLPLGEDNKFFEPSLFLLEILSKKSKNKVFLNKQAEWLFLCGRDAFLENIERNMADKDVFLVQNSLDENIGLGMKTKIKGKMMIKNLMDRGDFLRREK